MKPFNNAILRTSAYPFDFIQELYEQAPINAVDKLLADSFFMNALKLASPELVTEAKKIHEIKDLKKKEKLIESLFKYAARISSRSTPFGMFSGLSTISLSTQNEMDNEIVLSKKEKFRSYFRLDMNFSNLYASFLSQQKIIRKCTYFYPNTTLYELGNSYRLISYQMVKNKRKYDLISIEKNEYLDKILTNASKGILLEDLIQNLLEEDLDETEVRAYIEDIVDTQLIVSELETSTIGTELEFQLRDKLTEILNRAKKEDKSFIKNQLDYLNMVIDKMNHMNIQYNSTETYEELLKLIREQFPLSENLDDLQDKFIIQCNTYINLEKGKISSAQQENLSKAMDTINRFLTTKSMRESSRMKKFKEEFDRRYDGKIVSLTEALDVETGIGYGTKSNGSTVDITPLLDKVVLGSPRDKNTEEKIPWDTKFTSWWLKQIQTAQQNNKTEIKLTEEMLKGFDVQSPQYSSTFLSKATLLKNKNNEDVILLDFYAGGTASSWFGRFCNGDNQIAELTQKIVRHEKESFPDDIVAEINHLPESRLGNVIQRPKMRDYQINYLAGINDENESNISINDLMITVQQGKIILFSRKHNKRVVTFHSNAFNISYPNNLPLFQFLADYQETENNNGHSLNISGFHRFHNFIPRVTYGNIIIFRASWKFSAKDFEKFKTLQQTELLQKFQAFCTENKIPKYIMIAVGDNELLIDTTKEIGIRILLKEAAKMPTIRLIEFILNDFKSAVQNAHGQQFNNELLLPHKSDKKARLKFDFSQALRSTVAERFAPGSEWLYYKVYAGVKNADKLLVSINKLLTSLKDNRIIEKWFFIRYYDQSEHLRIRLHIPNPNSLGQVIQQMNTFFQQFDQEYKIGNIVIDTYQRELQRYGFSETEEFEKIFAFDSEMCAQLIDFFELYESGEKLWMAGIYSIYSYLELFGLNTTEKIKFTERLELAFRKEFNANSYTTKSLNTIYNENKRYSNTIFLTDEADGIYAFKKIVNERNKKCQPIVDGIMDRNEYAKKLFLDSVIHMNVNRLFRSKQRFFEFVSYAFLKKILVTLSYVKKDARVDKSA